MSTVGQLIFSGLLMGSIYALMSIGLTLIFGVLRIVNFAHGEFLMIAMYGAWAVTRYMGLNSYFAILAVMPAMFLFGILVHRLIIQPGLDKPHLVLVFATMGLSILMQNVALMMFSADLFDAVDRIAQMRWTNDEVATLLLRLSSAMALEVETLAALDGAPDAMEVVR